MSQSVEELKENYDKSLKGVIARYQAETMRVILSNKREGYTSSDFDTSVLDADKFICENEDDIGELSHEEFMELIKAIAS